METEALRNVEKLALKKHKIYKQSLIRYLARSMLASMFIRVRRHRGVQDGEFLLYGGFPFYIPHGCAHVRCGDYSNRIRWR